MGFHHKLLDGPLLELHEFLYDFPRTHHREADLSDIAARFKTDWTEAGRRIVRLSGLGYCRTRQAPYGVSEFAAAIPLLGEVE